MRSTVPAPDLPPGPRSALIIATSSYQDPDLDTLRAPGTDAAELAEILADPQVGGFSVTTVIDQDKGQAERAAARFLAGRDPGELVLVYLSCHGIQDARNRLYFACADTEKSVLAATGIESAWLIDRLEECRARRQIVILDCCYSGGFAGVSKGPADLENKLASIAQARGRVVLTASRDGEYSFEGESLDSDRQVRSFFTAGLIDGLTTGAADTDQDGLIDIEDAYHYAAAYVRERGAPQSPQRWVSGGEGVIVLARNPRGAVITPAPLPEDLADLLQSRHPHIRIGAVHTLADLLTGPNPALALSAQQALEKVAAEDAPSVAAAARAHLPTPEDPPPTPKPAPSPRPTRRTTLLLATASADGTARLWEPATGTCLRTLAGHSGPVLGLAFSPDGTLLATASNDSTARLWDPATGTCRATLTGHDGWVLGVAFSPDGALLATASDDKTARIWDTTTGTCCAIVRGHERQVRGVAFSPDGTLFATASDDKTARIWDTTTGTCCAIVRGHRSWVRGLAFSPDGALLGTASDDRTARLWDTATGTCRITFAGHGGPVYGVAFSPGGLRSVRQHRPRRD